MLLAYWLLGRFQDVLAAREYREREFWFRAPHSHAYLPEHDPDEEERLMAELPWEHSPLRPGDG